MTDLNFSTKGMNLGQKEESFKNGNIVPIGTICYESGDWLDNTEKIIVNENNQKIVSMFWNVFYFLDKGKADRQKEISETEYFERLYDSYYY